MITGQFPRRIWQPNPDGAVRTMDEAVAIARQFGVVIPDEVESYADDSIDPGANLLARSSRLLKQPGDRVYLSDLFEKRTGKITFRVWHEVLSSDEAIVAVLAHEMHELSALRLLLEAGDIDVVDLNMHTEPGRRGNLHDEAWDVADRKFDRMRGIDQ